MDVSTSVINTKILAVLTATATAALVPGPAVAAPAVPVHVNRCGPLARAVSFGDGLNKAVRNGVTVGGLSSIAFDRRTGDYLSTVDNHATDPARIWFWRNPSNPFLTRDPLVLKRADGTPYDGVTADNEGLAVLPGGDFVVSSELEPSIRIFGRDGVEKASLPMPARFAVAPAGESTANATIEGLTVTPDGTRLVAAMEGSLSGDNDPRLHRFLVYARSNDGTWKLTRQLAYPAESGLRIPEITAYGRDSLLVEEATFDPATGNTVRLFAVPQMTSTAPILAKTEVADLAAGPTLGATSPETQTNPLLDNFEGMAVRPEADGRYTVEMISDDNFNATQVTRVVTLTARLP